ncbi:SAM-dependent chlorinase/fluorinase [Phormidium sp. LEGE 05292]|uniref:SAM hydrolase/SAM-dependent halogenase family protein n=1 Tax=[Phormidium] sp. LEGE 05292 TaxID=767427 RepID=UPI001882554B|nr:SAM-dependent chlorinase/fluorinase [Phormidium sp. LEGE 05292]MBE9224403.1 SAM-dependent chlorinase/fluorinase [Phormidium sp. LEGE 05292]
MNKQRIVTLLTDFGLSDVYVGVMKGVIAQINPSLKVIDLTHEIPPQNLAAGRFCLMNAVPYFPKETVHIAVVDPGVGSNRQAVAIEFAGGFLVGPNNGLFSGIISQNPVISAVELTNSQYWRTASPSTTFHGRDIFAAVGAHLASGVSLEELGTVINPESLVKLAIAECREKEGIVEGCIQYIDRFGNLITNIPGNLVIGKTWNVEIAEVSIPGKKIYSDSPIGSLIALVGSHGWVEIAVNNGNAQSKLQLNYGDGVKILLN